MILDYTEQVYFLTYASDALVIQEILKRGDAEEIRKLDPEAIAWAKRVEWLPHVDVRIVEVEE